MHAVTYLPTQQMMPGPYSISNSLLRMHSRPLPHVRAGRGRPTAGWGPLQARTQLAMAHCVLSDVTPAVLATNPEQALLPLAAAAEGFATLGAVLQQADALYLQAMTLNTLGRTAERDRVATAFVACQQLASH